MEAAKEYVMEKIAEAPKPEATVKEVKFKSVGLAGVDYMAKVSVFNPYPTPLPICRILYSLKTGGREIATGDIADPGSLKAKGDTLVDVPVKVAHSALISLGLDICKDWDIDYQLDLTFVIDLPVIGDIRIPLTQKGEIPLPSLSTWFSTDDNLPAK